MRKLQVIATNQQSTAGGAPSARLSGIGSPTLGSGGGTPVKSKKVLPPAIPVEFYLQRRNSNSQKQRESSPQDLQPDNTAVNLKQQSDVQRALDSDQSILLLNHQQAVYYHQQLAIDALQADGAVGPSPLPPCRNSIVSVDSGRGASMLFTNGGAPMPMIPQSGNCGLALSAPSSSSSSSISTISSNNMNVLKRNGGGANLGGLCSEMAEPGLCIDTRDSSDNRCSSISSCSLGSVDRISTTMSMKTADDAELISDWLYEINCPDYYLNLFLTASYDLPTISRMNFEDLTAIGIRKAHEREFLIQHIKQLKTPDNLPLYVPNSIREFLRILNMEEYTEKMVEQNFSVRDICGICWEDLEDIGIVKLGHQKKILLAIKRIKDILSGKFVATPNQFSASGGGGGGSAIKNGSIGYFSISSASVSPSPPSASVQPMFNFQPSELVGEPQCGCTNVTKCGPHFELEAANELVPIKIHRKCNELQSSIPEEGGHSSHSISFNGQLWAPMLSGLNKMSMVDEAGYMSTTSGQEVINVHTGTLPRNFGGQLKDDKVRPVAKVQAQSVKRTQPSMASSSTALKETSFNIIGHQAPQPLYVNFGNLNNHVHHHHHFYGPDVQNADASGSLKRNSGINLVNTRAEIHHHLTPSNKSDKATTSLESIDKIPFANENSGTIKQRGGIICEDYYQHHHLHSLPNFNGALPSHQRNSNGGSHSSTGSDELAELECLDSLRIEDDDDDIRIDDVSAVRLEKEALNAIAPEDVLNDIGNMLANLTDELDAMLEEEKRAGLNDD